MEAVSYGILPVRGQSASRFTPLPSIAKVIGIEVTDKIRNSTGQQALLSLTPKSFAGQHGGQPRKSSQSSGRSVPSKPSVNLTGISGSAAVSASHRGDQSRSPGGQRVDGIPPPHTKKKIFHRSVRYGPSKSMRRPNENPRWSEGIDTIGDICREHCDVPTTFEVCCTRSGRSILITYSCTTRSTSALTRRCWTAPRHRSSRTRMSCTWTSTG